MFPADGKFKGLLGGNDGGFGGETGGPPPADWIFEALGAEDVPAADMDDGLTENGSDRGRDFLAVGLHFFEKMNEW